MRTHAILLSLALVAGIVSAEILDFDFSDTHDGWTMGHSNGARWHRNKYYEGVKPPNDGDSMMVVKSTGIHAGMVQMMSPRFKTNSTDGRFSITVEFMMKGTQQYPCHMNMRRAYDFTNYQMLPELSFDAYGDTPDETWHNVTIVSAGHEHDSFNFVFEAVLGIDFKNTKIAINRVTFDGLALVEGTEDDFFDFSNGLIGWTKGAVDGGTWAVHNHSQIEDNWYIPVPTQGDTILIADRYNIHSGVMSIESPMFIIEPGQKKFMNVRFWMRGTQAYPSSLRFYAKVEGDAYGNLPFLDLTPYGNVAHAQWTDLDEAWELPFISVDYHVNFQIVIEADIGGRWDNGVAIDAIGIHSLDPKPTPAPATTLAP